MYNYIYYCIQITLKTEAIPRRIPISQYALNVGVVKMTDNPQEDIYTLHRQHLPGSLHPMQPSVSH